MSPITPGFAIILNLHKMVHRNYFFIIYIDISDIYNITFI